MKYIGKTGKHIVSVVAIIFWNLILAAGTVLFLKPAGLVTGGVTGIALAVNAVSGIDVSAAAFILNMAALIAGRILLGKKFAMSTALSSAVFPVWLWILEMLTAGIVLTDDCMLCTVFSGMLSGVAIGMIIREGSSTGGVDVVSLLIHKYLGIPVSVCIYVPDALILLVMLWIYPTGNVLYGLINVIIMSITLDKVLLSGTSRTEIKIISRKHEAIRKAILEDLDRGVTLLEGKGGYTGASAVIILTVISNREFPKLQRLVEAMDGDAIMIVNRASQVSGHGFTLEKEYR